MIERGARGSKPRALVANDDVGHSRGVRIGFLFNHDQIHQVAHSLPIALALAKAKTGAEIMLIATNDRMAAEVEHLAGPAIGRDVTLIRIGLVERSSRLLTKVAGAVVPAAKLLIYREHLDLFRSLDVLVVAEKTSLVLKTRYGLERLKIVHTRHGAGDRAIGFDAASALFDHVLVAGAKIRDRLVAEAGVDPARISIVGYPKFDLFRAAAMVARTPRARPVVVYNPHVSPALSSWYKMGRPVLRWFARNPGFDLIFAPHVMLFERPLVATVHPPRIARPGGIARSIRAAPNILIDTCSRALTTMDYLNRADIYIGDASSQVYEFLLRPRPCIFFDAHRTEWRGDANYAHWTAGPVLNDVAALGPALAISAVDHASGYRAAQESVFAYTFDLNDTPSSDRAAAAIARVAGITPTA